MKKLRELSHDDLTGKKVLVRLDLNVPMSDEGVVHKEEAERIEKSQATLQFLKDAGAKVIVISHIGRDPKESLKPVAEYMNIPLFPLAGFDAAELENHHVVILENLRSDAREESNDEGFAKELAAYGDLYVNDAFAVSHRAHASVVGIPNFLSAYAGLQMEQEIENLNRAMHPDHPALLIMGGAKFETKLPVINKLLPLVDHVLIGGALVNNFYKEKGYEVGKSLLDDGAHLGGLVNDPKIMLPDQVVVQNDGENDIVGPAKSAQQISPADRIVDIVIPDEFQQMIAEAQTIIWNGPMGNYENGYTAGTESLTRAIAASSAFSIIGGGDSIVLIEKLGLADKFGFISTGGGAMLEYLAQGTLPGIEALEKNA